MLKDGLYEQVINKTLKKELETASDFYIEREDIDQAEAPKILANYIAGVIEKGLRGISDGDKKLLLQKRIDLINNIILSLEKDTDDSDFAGMSVDERAEQLLAVLQKKDNVIQFNKSYKATRPETSIAQSSLFTGSNREPSLVTEFKKEILSCDSIDMLVSFIKWSGLRSIIEELKVFTQNGKNLRIITTSYMGATDIKAVEELNALPNTEIKISYDTKRTRLHAKTYVFKRYTGFTTAYVGSSNLSNVAISSGLEWNVKVTAQDLPDTVKKINATFETYWNSNDFELYSEEQRACLEKALKAERYLDGKSDQPYVFDITPYKYQQEILDKLEAIRLVQKSMRNLIVAATGTGKTVIAAFDYKRFCQQHRGQKCKLLFVAHREEILKQARACFRGVLKDTNFGELFVGGAHPENIDHLFISVQTLNSQDLISGTSMDYYDYIIVDESHHAEAPTSYKKFLNYYKPRILLGLTATPERMDGKSILKYFDNRIAAEIRLPEAIERKLLCPFQYFGVTDTVDLNDLKWANGSYDKRELTNVYAIDRHIADKRASHILNSIIKYVTAIEDVKGLGFCVTIEHAEYMNNYFNEHNIASICLTSNSSDEERRTAKKKLVAGDVRFIFVVDIYNEGVDIPEVNTVLFLRPTESLTVFLQQLGRGLRLSEGKECLTVLDFIGQSNKRYKFADKFQALLANTERGLDKEIKNGFPSVPKGCFVQLEKQAQKYVLDNIRAALNTRNSMVELLTTLANEMGVTPTLKNFVEYYHVDTKDIYAKGTYSRLCVDAGLLDNFAEPIEEVLEKALGRICDIDSRRWLGFLLDIIEHAENLDLTRLFDWQIRMLEMFQFTVWQKSAEECGFTSLKEGLLQIKTSPVMCAELVELLQYNLDKIDFLDKTVAMGFDCPLDLYCSYTTKQTLIAMDYLKPFREGVKYFADKKVDAFFITLNKADKDYSPTTMYDDYSINDTLFHWQSQSGTSDTSPTGQRYINHKKLGTKVLLFVREYKTDKKGNASPYTFLGLANFVSYEGSKPMNIVWKLEEPIPAKFLKKTNKLVSV